MENNKLLPLSIIILAISIAFSAVWIGQSLKGVTNKNLSVTSQQNDILGLEEAAKYLNISKVELLSLTEGKGSNINFVKINGKYIFSKKALDKWVQASRLELQQ